MNDFDYTCAEDGEHVKHEDLMDDALIWAEGEELDTDDPEDILNEYVDTMMEAGLLLDYDPETEAIHLCSGCGNEVLSKHGFTLSNGRFECFNCHD